MVNYHVKVTNKDIKKSNYNASEGIITSTARQLLLQKQVKECIPSNMDGQPKGTAASIRAVLNMSKCKDMVDVALQFHAAT